MKQLLALFLLLCVALTCISCARTSTVPTAEPAAALPSWPPEITDGASEILTSMLSPTNGYLLKKGYPAIGLMQSTLYRTEDGQNWTVVREIHDDVHNYPRALYFWNENSGVITGKGLTFGGSLARTQATGYGLCYFSAEALRNLANTDYRGKTVVVSGSGNVAQYCAEKVTQLGGKVVAMSDSQGYVYDPNGIDLRKLFDIKQKRRARISVYAQEVEGATYVEGCRNIWKVKCDIAHPCASQNEMDAEGAQALVDNGCMAVFEGANMPLTPEAIAIVQQNGLLYSPGKASNAGGVATSGLEMSQNSIRMSWSFEEVDEKLHGIMKNIYKACYDASVECGRPGDLMVGANVAGFLKVAEAMMAQGIV